MTAPIQVRELHKGELEELQRLYDKTKDVRIRTRTQMILLAVEENMTAPKIGQIVRKNDQTVRRWMRRFNAEGINRLYDAPRPGSPRTVTDAYRKRVVSTKG